jgi:hypothetical protein
MADFAADEKSDPGQDRRRERAVPFAIRRLTPSDLDQLAQLHLTITNEVPRSIMGRRPDTYWETLFADRGAIFGAFSDRRLVAYSSVEFSSELGVYRAKFVDDIPEAELNNVAYYCGSGVHADFRGSELHRRLSSARALHSYERGCFHALAGVSTQNPFSLRNLLANGLFVKAIVPDEFGYDWFVHRDMRLSAPALTSDSRVTADAADTDLQKKLLHLGYWGISIENIKTRPFLLYAKHPTPLPGVAR